MSSSDACDLLVIGGGSGGLACAKLAAAYGRRVILCDFVTPSPMGTTWGLGGTCVNVGCIPKKLMHQAALHGHHIADSASFGWSVSSPPPTHDWTTLVKAVAAHIKSLNFGYKAELYSSQIEYLNARAAFVDANTVDATDAKGQLRRIKPSAVVVAVGGRPRYLDIPGCREHCITSDDLFSMKTPPGATLVVGASYVALECAGFLCALGFEVCVLVRSTILRGFDRDMVERVTAHMKEQGVQFVHGATPMEIDADETGRKRCVWRLSDGQTGEKTFDTVLLAVGREPCTAGLGLEAAGVCINPENGKIPTRFEQTNVTHIYALGDVIDETSLDPPSSETELTPVAIRAGRLLAARLFGGSSVEMRYDTIPTAVFTPLEYGACGLSEEVALKKYGCGKIEVFHTFFKPLEWTLPHRGDNQCYAKLVCHVNDSMRVVGLHICGPNAAEIVQGFAVAMRMGATKADFDFTVGVHPTVAEELLTLTTTRSSGQRAEKAGC